MTLAPIPPTHRPRILVGSVIRKPPTVVAAFLKALAWQRLRKPAEIGYAFTLNFGDEPYATEVEALVREFAKTHKTTIRTAKAEQDYGDTPTTRAWTQQAWHRCGTLKNQIIQQCMDEQWDALWLVDADVLCDPTTLQSLCDTECPIVAGVYWTHWQRPQPGSVPVIHAGPQVWLRHPYQLSGHGYTEADFRGALVGRQLVRVWGLGACTLFLRPVLEKGVSFAPVPEGLPPGPMSDGEDRHLCERARRLHLPMYADPWPDIWHAYHPAEYDQVDAWLERLAVPRPEQPTADDLVSIKIEPLEPAPHPQNPQTIQYFGPQYVRGRLGTLPVLPEIAEAVGGMTSGDRTIVQLHFPAHYEYPTLRGQMRLVAVTLLDAKPYRLPPVVEREMIVGGRSKAIIDVTTLTPQQADDVLETASAR